MKVNETTTVKGLRPSPCRVPDAIVCGLVDRVNVPAAQVAVPISPGVALPHWNWTALIGTEGQLVNEAAAAFTVRDQLFNTPFIFHETVAEVFPLTGVTSGSGELNVIVDGVTVTLPVMAKASVLTLILGNAAVAGGFD